MLLHTKPQGYLLFSGEDDFKGFFFFFFFFFFTIYERGGHLDHVTQMWRTNYRSHVPVLYEILALIGSVVSEE